MSELSRQLELLGIDETIRQQTGALPQGRQRQKLTQHILTVHELMSSMPSADELGFLHSGLAQTCLPHSKPDDDSSPWMRTSGRFSLIVAPGLVEDEGRARYVGVPYGTKARLIMIYLQTEGVRSRTVSLGPNLSSFLRSLGLSSVTGGKHGSITSVREQCLRIARCQFTMQWTDYDRGGRRDIVQDTKIVDGLELWTGTNGRQWAGTVELSPRFQEHLKEHAVPLDKRALAKLSDNSLGLDLYTLFAYRLPRLSKEMHLRWSQLQLQIGTTYTRPRHLSTKVRGVLPEVLDAYPGAKVEVIGTGITLYPSPPAVPKTSVGGFKLVTQG